MTEPQRLASLLCALALALLLYAAALAVRDATCAQMRVLVCGET